MRIRIVLSVDAEAVYRSLSERASGRKKERSVLNSITSKAEYIRGNAHFGNPVSRKLIPPRYHEEYGLTNLFRVELADRWRMLYTLTSAPDGDGVVAFILDILEHREYDRLFGYRKR